MTPFRAYMARLDAPVGPPAAKPSRHRMGTKVGAAHVGARKPIKARRLGARPRRPSHPPSIAAAPVDEAPLTPGGMTPLRPAGPAPLMASALATPVTVTVCENPTTVAALTEAGTPGWPPGVLAPAGDTRVAGPPPFPPGGVFPPGGPPFAPPGDEGPPLVVTPLAPPTGPGGVPEPASWAMMILGFGVVGAVARRRRRSA